MKVVIATRKPGYGYDQKLALLRVTNNGGGHGQNDIAAKTKIC